MVTLSAREPAPAAVEKRPGNRHRVRRDSIFRKTTFTISCMKSLPAVFRTIETHPIWSIISYMWVLNNENEKTAQNCMFFSRVG